MAYWWGLLLLVPAGQQAPVQTNGVEAAIRITALEATVKEHPESAEAWTKLGLELLHAGDARDASIYFRQGLLLEPDNRGLQKWLAQAYLDSGNIPAAAPLLEALHQTAPDDAGTRRMLGETMYRSGYFNRALELLAIKGFTPAEDRAAAAMYAVSLAKVGRTEEAEAVCKTINSSPQSPFELDAVLTYVEILDNSGRTTEAASLAETAAKAAPSNPMTHLWKARVLWHAGKNDDAAREARQSVALAPQLPFARNLLLQIYRKQGREEDARREAVWLRDYNDHLAVQGR